MHFEPCTALATILIGMIVGFVARVAWGEFKYWRKGHY